MNIPTISVDTVINKIYRDLKPSNPNWEMDAIEWVGEAIAHIGSGPQFEKKTAVLHVVGHRADLPADMVREQEVLYHGDTADGDPRPLQHTSWTGLPSFVPGETFNLAEGFNIQGGQVHTSFPDGYLTLLYEGYALDDSGRPLVPDDPSYMDAFLWYIIKQMMLGGWNHPNPQITFVTSEQRWLKYCEQARQKSKMPSVPEYDSFMKNWVRMVDLRDRRAGGFSDRSPEAFYGNSHLNLWYQNQNV